MDETPSRYCGNCGNELSPEDQFCRNCGTPVHQAARVPTPEADVSVPTPPQAGGVGGAAVPHQPPQQDGGGGRRNRLLLGCLGIIGLLLVLAIVGAAMGGGGGQQAADSPAERAERDEGVEGGGPEPEAKKPLEGEKAKEDEPQAEKPKPQPRQTYGVGQTATVGNVEWTVTDAFRTNQLKSGFGTQKRGVFVVVDFTFTNNRDEEVTIDPELHMILKDEQGREFGTDVDSWEFVPTNLNIVLEPVNPGLSKDGRVVYQVPPDAKGFTLTVDDVEFLEDKSAVFDLGVLIAREYDPSSASATATAGQ